MGKEQEDLAKSLANYGLCVKFIQPPVFVNKVLLEPPHSFDCVLPMAFFLQYDRAE